MTNLRNLFICDILLNVMGLAVCGLLMLLFAFIFGQLGMGADEVYLFSLVAASGIFFDRVLKREEKYKIKKMLLTLPLTVKEVLFSRYILACGIFIALTLIYFILGIFSSQSFCPLPSAYILPLTLCAFILLLSVRLALFHSFGFASTRFFYNLFIFLFLFDSLYRYVTIDGILSLLQNLQSVIAAVLLGVLIVWLSYRRVLNCYLK